MQMNSDLPEEELKLVTYRVLVRQPLSIALKHPAVLTLTIQDVPCKLAIRPTHDDETQRRVEGGSFIACEFDYDGGEIDLIAAARFGMDLVEDFLSAVSVVEGAMLKPLELLQVASLPAQSGAHCKFLQFLNLPSSHWERPLSNETVQTVGKLLAHWDGLEKGNRIRRAARQYRSAIGDRDDVTAFQSAYVGLEALEPVLATAIGLTPGTEVVEGKCESCGARFERKKTTLVGVRAFVLDAPDQAKADPQRKSDWRLLNKLRNDITHSLEDDDSIRPRAHEAMIAAMHYLHDAICVASHAPDQAKAKFSLARGPMQYLIVGDYLEASWLPLHEWVELLPTSKLKWVSHSKYGLVPEMSFENPGLKDLEIYIAYINGSLAEASVDTLKAANIERD